MLFKLIAEVKLYRNLFPVVVLIQLSVEKKLISMGLER